ncbi:MAG TPA: type II toxin-antitoxin system VapC family toxin [Miltoncostaeaceae bacterium]|nr:type II toxin-antitoxin system VapC family toxin [Miltoncostaeaceae bacterium]
MKDARAGESVIVLDASAAVQGLLVDGALRNVMRREALICPHLIDSEIAQTLRNLTARGTLTPAIAAHALITWRDLGVIRHAAQGLLGRIWELRENLSAYDATYVALAEAWNTELVTADERLARAPGPRCTITVMHR